MAIARVQHTYNHKSGLPVDAVVNTFHFSSGPTGAVLDATVAAALGELGMDFYDEPAAGMASDLQSRIAEASMATLRHTLKVYDMGHAEPRIPVYQLTTQHGTTNNVVAPGPAEVAICLSYRGAAVSGMNPARTRGRVYIGPLNNTSGSVDAAGHYRPTLATRDDFVAAGRGLQVGARAAGWPWVVYSRGGPDTGEFGGGWFPFVTEIVHCWCDDAFDTQRSRGPSPTTRSTLTF